MNAIVGVLGGMGPLATADFLTKLCVSTPARAEGDHIHTVTWSNPRVPNRTAALLGVGPSPVPALQEGVDVLVAAHADLLVIPCNTAHAFAPELSIPPHVQFVSMVESVAISIAQLHEGRPTRVGILATRGTRAAALYEDALSGTAVVIHVEPQTQRLCVDRAIDLVKAGHPGSVAEGLITAAAAELAGAGAQVILAACTEIPLIAGGAARLVPVVDTTQCLVDLVVSLVATNARPALAAFLREAK